MRGHFLQHQGWVNGNIYINAWQLTNGKLKRYGNAVCVFFFAQEFHAHDNLDCWLYGWIFQNFQTLSGWLDLAASDSGDCLLKCRNLLGYWSTGVDVASNHYVKVSKKPVSIHYQSFSENF